MKDKIIGVNRNNFITYAIGLVISIILVAIYFIDIDNPFCSLSCSLGSGGISAIFLAYFIDLANEKHIKKVMNYKIKAIFCDLVIRINWLFKGIYLQICECEKILDTHLIQDFNNKNLVEVLNIFNQSIEEIKNYTTPQLLGAETVSNEEHLINQKKSKLKDYLSNSSKLAAFSDKFEEMYNNFKINKTILLNSGICSINEITYIENIFILLSDKSNVVDYKLFVFQDCFYEFLDDENYIQILNHLGLDKNYSLKRGLFSINIG